jgi:general secretion pathway protein A
MYLHHYDLNKMPFDISPDPAFLWLGETHKEALSYLKYGILGNRRFLVVTGDVGTGKTALIKTLVKMIDVRAIVVTIPDPDLSRLDFYNFLANELKMEKHFSSKGEFLIHFKKFLLQAHHSSKKVLLIIDEAQRLNHNILQEIRFLANIDFGGQILINIFLVGQNEFKAILMEDRNKSVRDRVTASFEVKPLTENEVSGYIRHRLRVAGTTQPIFTPDAVRTVYRHTRGYPRLMNILCDRALLTGFIKEEKLISPAIVEEAAGDIAMTIGNQRPEEQKIRRPEKIAPPRFREQRIDRPEEAAPSRFREKGIDQPEEVAFSRFREQRIHRPEKAVPVQFKRPPRRNPMITPVAAAGLILLVGLGIYLSRDFIFENFQELKNHRIVSQITAWFQGQNQEKTPVNKQSVYTSGAALKFKKKDKAPSSGETMMSSTQSAARSNGLEKSPGSSEKIDAPAATDSSLQKGGAAQPRMATTGNKKNFVINFDPSSNEILPESHEVLDRITGIFFSSPVRDITIKGYTGSFGNENYEMYMSIERALQVKNFFVSKGIPESSLKVYGMGHEAPGAANTTAGGRPNTSRVEIEINLPRQ